MFTTTLVNSLLYRIGLALVFVEEERYLGNGEFTTSSHWWIYPIFFLEQVFKDGEWDFHECEFGVPHEVLCGTWITK